MNFEIKRIAVIHDDNLHLFLCTKFLNGDNYITSNFNRDEDLGYATFYIDVNKIDHTSPKTIKDIISNILKESNIDTLEVHYQTC